MSSSTFFGEKKLSYIDYDSFKYLNKSRKEFSRPNQHYGRKYFNKFIKNSLESPKRALGIYDILIELQGPFHFPKTTEDGKRLFFSDRKVCRSEEKGKAIKIYFKNIGIKYRKLDLKYHDGGYKISFSRNAKRSIPRSIQENDTTWVKIALITTGVATVGAIVYTLSNGSVRVPLERIALPGHIMVGGGHLSSISTIASNTMMVDTRRTTLNSRTFATIQSRNTHSEPHARDLIRRCGDGDSDRDPDRSPGRYTFGRHANEFLESRDGQILKEFGLSLGSALAGDTASAVEHGVEALRMQTESVWDSSKEIFDSAKDFFSKD